MEDMMKSLAILISAAIFAGCLSGQAGGFEDPVWPSSGGNAEENTIALKPGEKRVIVLHENVTTGFSWKGVSDSPCVKVTVEHCGPKAAKKNLCGAPGSARVTIAALPGFDAPASVTLVNSRGCESQFDKTVVYKIVPRK